MLLLLNILLIFITTTVNTTGQSNKIIVLNAESAVHPALTDYIQTGIEKVKEIKAECLIIQLNTPGGLLSSTRNIVSEFLQSEIPVVIYVSPSGAQAASAGVFITMASHIAAMAPGTNIGAAHPVFLQGVQDTILMEKATNDAAAFIRTISEKRKRNVQWGEDAVRKSLSITETEALELNVIDLIAKDVNELVELIDSTEIETTADTKIIITKDAEIIYLNMTIIQRLLSILSDPNIAYILLMLGIYGLFFELYNPGAIFPGVIGAFCLILAFYSINVLPVNYAGLALILLSVVLFILEVKIVSYGMLTIGGIVSLLMGSLMLIDPDSILEAMEISMELIIIVVVLTTLFFAFAITFGIKAQKRKPTTGIEGLIGERGVAITKLSPLGEIKVHGEFWSAESVEGIISKGENVEVIGIDKLKVKVKKVIFS
ncbi:MAG: nodulation protein NfeD [Bacteroidota bacterium]